MDPSIAETSYPLTAMASTRPSTPLPKADQVPVVLFHLAMFLAMVSPTVVKYPPTYTLVPLTAMVCKGPFVPRGPNRSSQFSSPDAVAGRPGSELLERTKRGG